MNQASASALRVAQNNWGPLSEPALAALAELVRQYAFCLDSGDILYLDGSWYVTHAGLLRLARRKHCHGIQVEPVADYCDARHNRWAFRATVFKTRSCKGFVGFGDADPSNVSSLVRGAEMRVAETRAVNRALRKAYGIGLCSIEEIGNRSNGNHRSDAAAQHDNGSAHPLTLRERLCEIIREYQLDAKQVKAYALDFCGTEKLRDASRELIEDFINHLSARAEHDRDALVAELALYADVVERMPAVNDAPVAVANELQTEEVAS